jgi:hypothetical protein
VAESTRRLRGRNAAPRSRYLSAEVGARKLCWKGYLVWLPGSNR